MRLDILLGGLENPQPAVRLDVVRVLGMLDETQALDRLRERFAVEPDADVRNTIAWAGKRLYQAQQAGYSTLNEVFRHFGVDREIESAPDAREAELMRQMQHNLDRDLMNMQTRATTRRAGMAAAAAIGGTLAGGLPLGMIAMSGAMAPGAEAASSSLGGGQRASTRAPAMAPSNADIAVWIKRLREAPNPDLRETAALELSQLNNPKALPVLAAAFVNDESPKVRQAAQRFGKILYWSATYWEMEQDGTLAQEIERRAAELGKTIKSAPSTAAPGTGPLAQGANPAANASPEPPVDVSEILRKAQQARDSRKRKT